MSLSPLLGAVHPEVITPQTSLARAIGLGATLYGYPLVEIYRTCVLQTQRASPGWRALNTLRHVRHLSTPSQREVVTPSDDLLYSHAWLSLYDGPLALSVPASAEHPGHHFILSLYDAYTENFLNLGPRNCAPGGETVWLVGPTGGTTPPGARVVHCPTALVWLIARVLVRHDKDLQAAQALQSDIRLHPCCTPAHPPWALKRWKNTTSVMDARRTGANAEHMAPAFFTDFCMALKEAPGRPQDQNLLRWIRQAGLHGDALFDWQALAPWRREGLAQGFAEAIQLLAALPLSRTPQPWRTPPVCGRYGSDYLSRALAASTALGALCPDEVLYGISHFSADRQPLHGRHRYVLRLAPDQGPAPGTLWSLTLYDADGQLHANPLNRHGFGDRCPWLAADPDGHLNIHFAHQAPSNPRNWLPTPAGPFHLVMRLYLPQEGAPPWSMPALQRSDA